MVMLGGFLACSGGGGGGDGGPSGPPPPPPGTTLGSITTNHTTITMGAGSTASLVVTAYDVNNQVIANPGTPTFTSASPAIAEVDGSGNVLGIAQGSTQITVRVTLGTVTRTADIAVTVTGALPVDAGVVASSSDYIFTPGTVAIRQGGSVTWTFGTLEHTVTFSGASGAPSNIGSGYAASVSRNFGSKGDFVYNCSIHAGMSGKVIVR
jgi:plastocyanin